MSPNDADGMANSVDPDLGLHCLPISVHIYLPISVRKLWIITVIVTIAYLSRLGVICIHKVLYDPEHGKTTEISCAHNEDSDRPGHEYMAL